MHHGGAGQWPHGKHRDDERLQHRLRKLVSTSQGRQRLRERIAVEHRLAHLGRRQGHRARYCGTRKNLFDLRRTAAVQNLEVIDRGLQAGVGTPQSRLIAALSNRLVLWFWLRSQASSTTRSRLASMRRWTWGGT